MDASLKEAQSSAWCWELEAREVMDKAAWVEAERDAARHEVVKALLETNAASSAWAQIESKLTLVQCGFTTSEGARLKAESELDSIQQALATAKEAYRKAEEEIFRLTDE